jgi:hypothetical protein
MYLERPTALCLSVHRYPSAHATGFELVHMEFPPYLRSAKSERKSYFASGNSVRDAAVFVPSFGLSFDYSLLRRQSLRSSSSDARSSSSTGTTVVLRFASIDSILLLLSFV